MPNIEEIKNTLWSLIDGPEDWWQWGIIVGCVLLAIITRFTVHKIFEKTETKFEQILIRQVRARKGIRSIPVFFCLYLWLFQSVLATKEVNCGYIYTIAVLVSAYCIYKLAVSFSKGQLMPRLIGIGMLVLFILQQIGWLEPLKSVLTSIHFNVGNIKVDIFKIASAVVALFILMWLVGIITKLLDNVVNTRKEIPPSIRVLIGKTTRLLLYVSAFLITLKVAGFPLGALAVFSGALGLGLGFGLQKVISNLVSGVIILLDKSIKPGDVIEINGTYGWINTPAHPLRLGAHSRPKRDPDPERGLHHQQRRQLVILRYQCAHQSQSRRLLRYRCGACPRSLCRGCRQYPACPQEPRTTLPAHWIWGFIH